MLQPGSAKGVPSSVSLFIEYGPRENALYAMFVLLLAFVAGPIIFGSAAIFGTTATSAERNNEYRMLGRKIWMYYLAILLAFIVTLFVNWQLRRIG